MSKSKIWMIGLLGFSVAGCADYMNHWDSVTFGAGSAAEGNTAIHVVDPWPPNVDDTTIKQHGKYNPLGQPKVKNAQ